MINARRLYQLLALLVGTHLVYSACGGELDRTQQSVPDFDAGADIVSADASEGCGRCGDGHWLETSDGARRCAGASVPNVCGGCAPLAVSPGGPCGPCGGTWVCDAERGEIVCEGGAERNACGGCEPLDLPVNFGCFNGIYTCDGPNDVLCRETGANVCGGDVDTVFDPAPGTPCGMCGQGVIACASGTSTACVDGDLGTNVCGGCDALQGEPGTPCDCGAVWTCIDGDVMCDGPNRRNACGGCEALAAGLGEPCAGGLWRCDGDDALQCVPAERNACGGRSILDGAPGDRCGPCQDGFLQCRSADALTCVAASQINACGGCGVLNADPGTACGTGRTWQCRGGTLDCAVAGTLNACGGVETLAHDPGAACGECGAGVALCVSPDQTACFGGADARNACGGCEEILVDGAPFGGVPGDACGICDSGTWTCEGPDAVSCVGQIEATLRLVHADRDGDGFGNPLDTRQVCALPAGYVENDRDCNDADGDALPGGIEVCNDQDDDCDGEVDESFVVYADADLDGFGDAAEPSVRCTVTQGFSATADDCDDSEARAFPGQELGFAEPLANGGWDYDCDGESTPTLTDSPRCQTPPLCGTDGYTYATEGWALPNEPGCGEQAAWIVRCELTLSGCTSTIDPDPRPQLCR